MDDATAWQLELRLWIDPADVYDDVVSDACVMAFPGPGGIMKGAAIRAGVRAAPRWRSVKMTERTIGRPDDDTIVLGYKAVAERPDRAPYRAVCTSTYRRDGDAWKIVQHQQTAII